MTEIGPNNEILGKTATLNSHFRKTFCSMLPGYDYHEVDLKMGMESPGRIIKQVLKC